jgi:hypothetical protein
MLPLGAANPGATSLGSTNIGASSSRRPKEHAPSPPSLFPIAICTAGEALTPQHRPKAAYIDKRRQSNRKTTAPQDRTELN